MERYASADTCIVSLRDDWKSFETTVPSKTYEVLAVGRHVTAMVRGEAARIIADAEAGDIVASDPEALAALWRELAADRGRLVRNGDSRQWVKAHAEYGHLASRYMDLITELLRQGTRRYPMIQAPKKLPARRTHGRTTPYGRSDAACSCSCPAGSRPRWCVPLPASPAQLAPAFHAVRCLLASLMRGDKDDVVRRLRLAADRNVSGEKARKLADIALVANQPELSDLLLAAAGTCRRPQIRAGTQALA